MLYRAEPGWTRAQLLCMFSMGAAVVFKDELPKACTRGLSKAEMLLAIRNWAA